MTVLELETQRDWSEGTRIPKSSSGPRNSAFAVPSGCLVAFILRWVPLFDYFKIDLNPGAVDVRRKAPGFKSILG